MISFVNRNGRPANTAINDALRRYNTSLVKGQVAAMELAAIYVEGEAKRNIRVIKQTQGRLIDTANMVNSITHTVQNNSGKITGIVGTNVFYAVYGTPSLMAMSG